MLRIGNKSALSRDRRKEQFQRIAMKTRSGRVFMRQFACSSCWQNFLYMKFPIRITSCENHIASDDGIPDPQFLKNVEQNYATINEFIFVVKLWMDFSPWATMYFSMFSAATLMHAHRGVSIKLLFRYHLFTSAEQTESLGINLHLVDSCFI